MLSAALGPSLLMLAGRFRPAVRAGFVRLLGLALLSAHCAVAASETAREAGLPWFEAISPRDYRGHTQVWCGAEDRAGLLYFGNYGRVLVHDGSRWEHLEVPGTTFVRGLAVDADDTLWIGAVHELGFARTDPTGRRTFVSLKDQLPADLRECGEIWRVVLSPHGPVFQTNSHLFRWDGARFATLALQRGGRWQMSRVGAAVWITHSGHGWFELRDDGARLALTPLPRPADYQSGTAAFVLPGPAAGEALIGTGRGGLQLWRDGSLTPFAHDAAPLLKNRTLYHGARLADGRLVVCTLEAGAFIIDRDGRLLAQLNESTGFPDNTCIAAFVDARDQLWLGLDKGLARIDTRRWLTWFNRDNGAPRSNLSAPLRWRGQLYVPAQSGLFRLEPATGAQPARLAPVLNYQGAINGLAATPARLIASTSSGIFDWDGHALTDWTPPVTNAFSLVPSERHPDLWFSLADGALHGYRQVGDRWQEEEVKLGSTHLRSLAEDREGSLWLGTTTQGVVRARFPRATAGQLGAPDLATYGVAQGLPPAHGWTRVTLVGGQPLLTCEQGLYRYDAARDRFAPTAEFGARFADGTTTTRSFVPDRPGGLWVAARPAGQAEIVTTLEVGLATSAAWRPLPLPQLPRLDDVSAFHLEPDTDVLWIAGHGGLLRVDLADWRSRPPPAAPTVLLRSARTDDGVRLPAHGAWRLQPHQRSLLLQFAAPRLAGDGTAQFETSLDDGSRRPLVQISASPEREFAALSPGDYELQARARGAEGPWSVPLSLRFTIARPWWSAPGALALWLLLAGAGVTALISLRTRALRQRAAALESAVAARTRELQASNTELARLHRLELDEKTAARLETLRYQLNPHFLFNALNSIYGLVLPHSAAAGQLVRHLADFCRNTLTRPHDQWQTLGEEFAMLRSYLDIEQARWRDQLRLEIQLDPACHGFRLPPLLLLPLVENAIKHGGATSPGVLTLRLAAHRDADGSVALTIQNSGTWSDTAPDPRTSTQTGLANLRERLARAFGPAHQLTLQAADGWVTLTLRLPPHPAP